MIKLKNLLKEMTGYEIKGSKERVITAITSNSKRVAPGLYLSPKKVKLLTGIITFLKRFKRERQRLLPISTILP